MRPSADDTFIDAMRRSLDALAASRALLAATRPYPDDPAGPTLPDWAHPPAALPRGPRLTA